MGVSFPSRRCRRRRCRSFRSSRDGEAQFLSGEPPLTVQDVFCSCEKNDSIAALSAHAPTLPIDPVGSITVRVKNPREYR